MWKYECRCGASVASSDFFRMNDNWNLSSVLCPCHDPMHPVSRWLSNWEDYYEWRSIPLHSTVSLLLHWPLTVYHAIQLAASRNLIPGVCNKVHIHYLGPEKELLQIAVFSELLALFPGSEVHITFIGPEIPQFRDGEKINLCSYACCTDIDCMCKSSTENGSCGISDCGTAALTLQFYKGLYHERYGEIVKDSFPHLVVALNAGIAAYSSWSPTINLIKEMDVPAIFSDYCEEAAYLAGSCISTLTGHPLRLPIQLNPFRQPMAVEDSALFLPCYSNCYLFGM